MAETKAPKKKTAPKTTVASLEKRLNEMQADLEDREKISNENEELRRENKFLRNNMGVEKDVRLSVDKKIFVELPTAESGKMLFNIDHVMNVLKKDGKTFVQLSSSLLYEIDMKYKKLIKYLSNAVAVRDEKS